jgi:hypothetical protein
MKSAKAKIAQLPLAQWEHGLARDVAVLKLEPTELCQRLGIDFEATCDDLDKLDAALLKDSEGHQFALTRHHHNPSPGTGIVINEKSSDFTRDLNAVMAALQLTAQDCTWVHPSVELSRLTF